MPTISCCASIHVNAEIEGARCGPCGFDLIFSNGVELEVYIFRRRLNRGLKCCDWGLEIDGHEARQDCSREKCSPKVVELLSSLIGSKATGVTYCCNGGGSLEIQVIDNNTLKTLHVLVGEECCINYVTSKYTRIPLDPVNAEKYAKELQDRLIDAYVHHVHGETYLCIEETQLDEVEELCRQGRLGREVCSRLTRRDMNGAGVVA